MSATLLDKCKLYIRKFKADVLDEEVQDLIDAAQADLRISGVVNQPSSDPLIIRAITTYVKGHFGYENKDSEKFLLSYESLKIHLALCSEYTESENECNG